MAEKVWNWVIAAGGLLALVGLLIVPVALNPNGPDHNMLGGGLALFGSGAVIIALSLYLKARVLRAQIDANPELAAMLSNKKKRKGNCDGCETGVAVVLCTMHKAGFCGACLSQHYEPRACVLVPATRRTGKSARGTTAARA